MIARSLALALVVLSASSCRRSEAPSPDGAELGIVGRTFDTLSQDLRPLLAGGSISNMEQLRAEYSQRFPDRSPLFFNKALSPARPRGSEYELPARAYFWLREWNVDDAASTPLFWSYFHVPNDVVSYLTITGAEQVCSSNEFFRIIAPLSNRVERATSDQ